MCSEGEATPVQLEPSLRTIYRRMVGQGSDTECPIETAIAAVATVREREVFTACQTHLQLATLR